LILGAAILGVGNGSLGFLDKIENGNLFFGLSILIRVVTAIGESALTPAAFSLAAEQLPPEHKGKATSLAESFTGIGSMFGPTIGGILFDIGGFPWPFWVFGGLALFLSILCALFLKDVEGANDEEDLQRDVTWAEVLTAPGVPISIVLMVAAGVGWQWYSPSLDPWMESTFGLTASQTGLVFLAFGLAYTIFSFIFGYLTDKGLDGMSIMTIGNLLIMIAFIFLGPVPPLLHALGNNLWLSVFSLTIQGIGSAATYIGSLLFMMKGVSDAGLPDKEQTRGMVSSLWVISDCVGGYLGDTLGSLAYDSFGFETGTGIIMLVMLTSVISAMLYSSLVKVSKSRRTSGAFSNEEIQSLLK